MSVIPATWEVEIGKIKVRGQPRKNVFKTPISANKQGVVTHVCNLIYAGGGDLEDLHSRLVPGKRVRSYLKNNLKRKRLKMWLKGKILSSNLTIPLSPLKNIDLLCLHQ
jgi:hypothetical protein